MYFRINKKYANLLIPKFYDNYNTFGSIMPGREYTSQSVAGYRFGFNGKEMEDEISGDGNIYDYGFRIYNPMSGRFLSLDPLFKSYPELTPYQFASNRPIDGIDLDGLEYLASNFSRVEFTYGRLEIKVENFLLVNKNAFDKANNDLKNWTKNEQTGKKDIGIDETVYKINFKLVEQKKPESTDLVDLPTSAEGQTKTGAPKPFPSIDKGSKVETTHYAPNSKPATRTMGVLSLISESYKMYCDLAAIWDLSLIDEHKTVARKVIDQVNEATKDVKLIPLEYQTPERLSNIMNYVLQGVNNTSDTKISEIGRAVYNKFNPPPPTIILPTTVQYQQDNLKPIPSTQQAPAKKSK